MDRHLFRFLERAGLGKLSYQDGQTVLHLTADKMGLKRADLDHSIWRYMSGVGTREAEDLSCDADKIGEG